MLFGPAIESRWSGLCCRKAHGGVVVTQAEISKEVRVHDVLKGVPHEFQIALKKRFDLRARNIATCFELVAYGVSHSMVGYIWYLRRWLDMRAWSLRISGLIRAIAHLELPAIRVMEGENQTRVLRHSLTSFVVQSHTAAVLITAHALLLDLHDPTTKLSLQWMRRASC